MKTVSPTRKRSCQICKNKFAPDRPFQRVCSVPCAIEKSGRERVKSEKKALQKRREAARPLSWYHQQAQTEFNRFIRLRDAGKPCVSCGRTDLKKVNAGHYRPRGGQGSALRYNELNCWLQCEPCNTNLSGNLTLYRVELINRIGLKLVEWLEAQNAPTKWTIEELKYVREHYRLQCKRLIADSEHP